MKLLVIYKMKSAGAAGFLGALHALGFPEAVRAEEGCVRYEYYLPAEGDADRVLLVEEWKSAELQALHMEQPHMKRLAEIKPEYVSETTVEVIAERQRCGVS